MQRSEQMEAGIRTHEMAGARLGLPVASGALIF
jgi:hypothetical protein